jgi:hypothetical protein
VSKYILVKDVPILDEHVLRDHDGNPIAKLDGAKLTAIAHKANQRLRETGDAVPIVIGHTKDDAPELSQPPVVGYAVNFKVGKLLKSGRKAILATFKLLRSQRELIKRFPRRSVELWLDDLTIDPISLLGATTPERDLGLLQLSHTGRSCRGRPFSNRDLTRPRQLSKTPPKQMENKELLQELMAMLEQTDVFQWAKQQMSKMGEDKADTAASAAEDENDLEVGDEMAMEGDLGDLEGDLAGLEDDTEAEFGAEEEELGEEPVRMCATCGGDHETAAHKVKMQAGSPSGTNTYVPGGSNDRKGHNPEEHGKPKKKEMNDTAGGGPITGKASPSAGTSKSKSVYGDAGPPATKPVYPGGNSGFKTASKQSKKASQSSSMIRMARMERAVAVSQQAVSEMKVKLQRATREKDLTELEAMGYDFDRGEELDAVQDLSDEKYMAHLARIKKRYQKAPISGNAGIDVYKYARSDAVKTKANGMSKDRMREVASYASNRGVSFASALEELGSQQPETY